MASALKQQTPDHPGSVAVMAYSLSFLLNMILIIVLSLLIALITGRIESACYILLGFPVLRQVSGGVHLDSAALCIVVSVSGVTAASFVPDFAPTTIQIVTLITAAYAAVFAPSRIEQQTRISRKYFPMLRAIAVGIILLNLIICSAPLAIAFAAQAASLTRRKGGDNQ